jgi:RNA polymerase sigma factor (sigma-70 family)
VPTDEELIAEILKGSQAAMEVLVKRYYKTAFAFIYRKLGDYHTAYDLTQEVFIRVLKALQSYRESSRFEHWLMKITVNCCRDYFRSREFAEKNCSAEFEDTYAQLNVTDLFQESLSRQEIKDAILSLPEEQKETVILYFCNGYKIREISKLMSVKESTVKSRLHQASMKLRKILSGGEYGEKQ